MCRVSGGMLGIPCSSVIGLGWQPLAVDQGGTQCWESCCLMPSCGAVWSVGGYCVLLKCARPSGCEISALPPNHINSLGILQLLDKSKSKKARIPRQAWVADANGGPGHKRSNHVCVVSIFLYYNIHCKSLIVFARILFLKQYRIWFFRLTHVIGITSLALT